MSAEERASLKVSPHEVPWESATPTKKVKRLWYDASLDRIVQLTRFEPGAIVPHHRHAGNELIYVIEGDVTDDSGTVVAGGMSCRPTGCVHTVTSRYGSTAFAIVTGPNEDPSAAGPRSVNYILSEIAWMPLGQGVHEKLVWQGRNEIPRAALLRMEPGATRHRERSAGTEFIFVIEGSYSGNSSVVTGDLEVLPSGSKHSMVTKNGVTFLSLSFAA